MTRSGLLDEVGDDNVFGNLDDALDRARAHLGLPPHEHLLSAPPTVARESGDYPAVPR
jgi:SulP family sulfate permease